MIFECKSNHNLGFISRSSLERQLSLKVSV